MSSSLSENASGSPKEDSQKPAQLVLQEEVVRIL
jgi:hypothetical protein